MEDELSVSEMNKLKSTWEIDELRDQMVSEKLSFERRVKILMSEKEEMEWIIE